MLTRLAAAAAIAASLSLVACGDDATEAKDRKKHQATPARARAEAGTVRKLLTAALTTYKGGDAAAAAKQVEDAYLEHFEDVEGALGATDAELNEELEHAIREDLVKAMKDGKPAGEVRSMVQDIDRDLVTAQAALR